LRTAGAWSLGAGGISEGSRSVWARPVEIMAMIAKAEIPAVTDSAIFARILFS
jgi:hypothetical protein